MVAGDSRQDDKDVYEFATKDVCEFATKDVCEFVTKAYVSS